MRYVIESGVPIPPPMKPPGTRGRPQSELTLVLDRMEVGQSVLLTDADDYTKVRGRFVTMKPRHFVSRKSRAGWRIWRVL